MEKGDWNIIKSTPLFTTMSPETIDTLFNRERPVVQEKKTILFEQGAPANAFYIILDGWVKVYRLTAEGDEAVIGIFTRGETFAEAAMFLGGRYPASAEAVTTCRLIKIDGDHLRKTIHQQPDLALSMLASSSKHLKYLVEQIEQIKLLPGSRRLADFLLKLCPDTKGECTIELPYEKALIAGRLGMKPESFSRALSKLKGLGIYSDHENIIISDVSKLSLYVETGQNL